MTRKTEKPKNKEEPELQKTSDINLATFIKEVKGIDAAGHFFVGRQLSIRFDITKEQMDEFSNEYINSIFARCDATRRNFLRLLK